MVIGNPIRILLIDVSPDDRNLFHTYLAAVPEAIYTLEALDAEAPNLYTTAEASDCIVLDVDSSETNVLADLCTRLPHAADGRPITPIIMVTSVPERCIHWLVNHPIGYAILPRSILSSVVLHVMIAHAQARSTHYLQGLADLHAARESATRMEEAIRRKDEVLATLSHEMRTPLANMIGRSELLLEEVYGPLAELQRHAVSSIASNGSHLLSLISELLNRSRTEAQNLAPDVNLAPLCLESLDIVRYLARQKGVRLVYMIGQAIPPIMADSRQIIQILVNLLTNAVKFTPIGGTVGMEVVGDSTGSLVRIEVWDTGVGIAAADQERIFQPFTQLAQQPRDGVGLGLALVYRLVQAHNGRINLESTPGKGSRFMIDLPVMGDPGAIGHSGIPTPAR